MNLLHGALLFLIGRNIRFIRAGVTYRWFLLAFWICLGGFALTQWTSLGILCGVLLISTVAARWIWRRNLYAEVQKLVENHKPSDRTAAATILETPGHPSTLPRTSLDENHGDDGGSGDPQAFIAEIPKWAETHVEMSKANFDVALDYSEESLYTIDEIISKHWDSPPVMMDDVVLTFGSYVGETIRRLQGGTWRFDNELGFTLTDIGGAGIRAFPFAKVHKRFTNGEEDSIAHYYRALCKVMADKYGPK